MSLKTLIELDQRVDAAEGDGIRARWEFGRELLTERVGKQLPKGRLDEVVAEIGKSRQEIGYRMMFAERFPTEAEVSNAIGNFGSWYEIVNRALPRAPKPPIDTPELPDGTYATIVADPPWEISAGPGEYGGSGGSRALEYPTMSIDAIKALPVQEYAAPDAHLYLWTINHYIDDAYDVARGWGFEPSTLLTWCKKPHGIGLGGAYILTTEFVVFARRGSLAELTRVPTSWFDWPRRRHSVKPAEFFAMVERVSPGPYLELFNLGGRKGWTTWPPEEVAA